MNDMTKTVSEVVYDFLDSQIEKSNTVLKGKKFSEVYSILIDTVINLPQAKNEFNNVALVNHPNNHIGLLALSSTNKPLLFTTDIQDNEASLIFKLILDKEQQENFNLLKEKLEKTASLYEVDSSIYKVCSKLAVLNSHAIYAGYNKIFEVMSDRSLDSLLRHLTTSEVFFSIDSEVRTFLSHNKNILGDNEKIINTIFNYREDDYDKTRLIHLLIQEDPELNYLSSHLKENNTLLLRRLKENPVLKNSFFGILLQDLSAEERLLKLIDRVYSKKFIEYIGTLDFKFSNLNKDELTEDYKDLIEDLQKELIKHYPHFMKEDMKTYSYDYNDSKNTSYGNNQFGIIVDSENDYNSFSEEFTLDIARYDLSFYDFNHIVHVGNELSSQAIFVSDKKITTNNWVFDNLYDYDIKKNIIDRDEKKSYIEKFFTNLEEKYPTNVFLDLVSLSTHKQYQLFNEVAENYADRFLIARKNPNISNHIIESLSSKIKELIFEDRYDYSSLVKINQKSLTKLEELCLKKDQVLAELNNSSDPISPSSLLFLEDLKVDESLYIDNGMATLKEPFHKKNRTYHLEKEINEKLFSNFVEHELAKIVKDIQSNKVKNKLSNL